MKVLGSSGQRIRRAKSRRRTSATARRGRRTNPLKLTRGWSVEALHANIATGQRHGLSPSQAAGMAFRHARKQYRAAHPRGPYPAHLIRALGRSVRSVPRARNPAAAGLPVRVHMGGAVIAQFRSLPRANQYAQALANKARRQVRVTA